MKSKEELNVLKEEVEALNRKLRELTDDELEQVTGGNIDHSVSEVIELLLKAQREAREQADISRKR